MSEQFDKIAACANYKSKIVRLIVANIAEFSSIPDLVEEFVTDPSAENAEALEMHFNSVAGGFEAVRNAINSLAKITLSEELPEEVDVTYDENGARLL